MAQFSAVFVLCQLVAAKDLVVTGCLYCHRRVFCLFFSVGSEAEVLGSLGEFRLHFHHLTVENGGWII